jgi:hypothetical protein
LLESTGFTNLTWGQEVDVFAGSTHEAEAKEFETYGVTLSADKGTQREVGAQGPVSPPVASNVFRTSIKRSLGSGDPQNLQIHFDVAVLERYRENSGYSLVRTNTVGRVRLEGGWSLDFGIAPEEDSIHASVGSLQPLPEAERSHWASFAISLPVSRIFLQMSLSRGSCFEDGEVRGW